MREDWFQATVKLPPVCVLSKVGLIGDSVIQDTKSARKMHYPYGFQVIRDGMKIAAGGFHDYHEGQHTHILATSDNAPEIANLLRTEFGKHLHVTRIDVCQDFETQEAFDSIRKIAKKIAKDHRVSFPAYEDSVHSWSGRTQYIGSKSAECMARLYDKGYEQLAKWSNQSGMPRFHPEDIDKIELSDGRTIHPKDLIRLELQVRPKDPEARQTIALLEPAQVWGFSKWSKELAEKVFNLELERFYFQQKKHTTDERALRVMCSQYGKVLMKLHLSMDLSDQELGAHIIKTVRQMNSEKTAIPKV